MDRLDQMIVQVMSLLHVMAACHPMKLQASLLDERWQACYLLCQTILKHRTDATAYRAGYVFELARALGCRLRRLLI